ncbi:hypothetical protein B0H11DRAFT_1904999 [Mycena galericulata]|nr:hypothetical protein B0H11DRAFT_1904999 [Mycena galericulata]
MAKRLAKQTGNKMLIEVEVELKLETEIETVRLNRGYAPRLMAKRLAKRTGNKVLMEVEVKLNVETEINARKDWLQAEAYRGYHDMSMNQKSNEAGVWNTIRLGDVMDGKFDFGLNRES